MISILLFLATGLPHTAQDPPTPITSAHAQARPTELFEVVRVVDGDTLHVRRGERLEKLRLFSVDTEEKISGRAPSSPTKPETVFGEETALWAQDFFERLATADGPPRVGLLFPGGEEQRDAYDRLLCHVVLPDGRDFGLLLVELGKSPYFDKYGKSRELDEAFVEAQASARKKQRGIWDPATNRPRTPDAPSARRPYERLLPWWNTRAEAVAEYRRRRARDPDSVFSTEEPAHLARALERTRETSAPVEVFGEVERLFEERDGSLTVLFRGRRGQALRATVPAAQRGQELERGIRASMRELRQNYFFVRGPVVRGPRGFRIEADGPRAWNLAGPEPVAEGGNERRALSARPRVPE